MRIRKENFDNLCLIMDQLAFVNSHQVISKKFNEEVIINPDLF